MHHVCLSINNPRLIADLLKSADLQAAKTAAIPRQVYL